MKNTFQHENKFICECGKEFVNSQAFNGHRSNCKVHYLKKYGNLEKYNEMCLKRLEKMEKGCKKHKDVSLENQEHQKQKWIEEKHVCEKCGKVMIVKYGSGRFCSRKCSNSKTHTDKTKEKISASLRNNHPKKEKPCKYCMICNKPIKIINKTGMCRTCLGTTKTGKKILSDNSKKSIRRAMDNGFKPKWQSKNIRSRSERFWEKILIYNHIEFKKEFPIKHISQNYLLDFYIEINGKKIDLEIDGKQHNLEERKKLDLIRDEFLKENGFIIYRIKWNRIKTKNEKNLMRTKIKLFLDFYNNLSSENI